ncbi:MAG: LPS assembly lipoprotein LptE [Burkholderiaceae bacterium]|nr:LPS assembly lipoprotein LptE [Burkholderiaceae bacterium]
MPSHPTLAHQSLTRQGQHPTRRRLLKKAAGLVLLGSAGLAGCGFKFQARQQSLSFQRVLILNESVNPVTQGLSQQLQEQLTSLYGVQMVAQRADAQLVIRLQKSRLETVAVGFSSAGRPRELEVRASLYARLENAVGDLVQPAVLLDLRRTYSVNDSEVLAAAESERFQIENITRDLQQQLLRRLVRIQSLANPVRSPSS